MRGYHKNNKSFSDKWIECRVKADLAVFPASLELVIPLRKSLPFFLFSVFWTLASLFLLADASKDSFSASLFALIFVMAGVALLVWSSGRVGARQIILFDEDAVSVCDASLFRPARLWQKPYGEFKGLVMRQCRDDYDNHTTYYQVIELLGSSRDQCVPLYIQSEMGAPRKALLAYALRLSLPAFQARSGRMSSIEPFEE